MRDSSDAAIRRCLCHVRSQKSPEREREIQKRSRPRTAVIRVFAYSHIRPALHTHTCQSSLERGLLRYDTRRCVGDPSCPSVSSVSSVGLSLSSVGLSVSSVCLSVCLSLSLCLSRRHAGLFVVVLPLYSSIECIGSISILY
jgi:hypothetical protein